MPSSGSNLLRHSPQAREVVESSQLSVIELAQSVILCADVKRLAKGLEIPTHELSIIETDLPHSSRKALSHYARRIRKNQGNSEPTVCTCKLFLISLTICHREEEFHI